MAWSAIDRGKDGVYKSHDAYVDVSLGKAFLCKFSCMRQKCIAPAVVIAQPNGSKLKLNN